MEDFQYQYKNKQKELWFGKLVKMVRKGVFNGITTSYRISKHRKQDQVNYQRGKHEVCILRKNQIREYWKKE